jgi:LuxR family quorum-sensing system transcriptional regulator CciR
MNPLSERSNNLRSSIVGEFIHLAREAREHDELQSLLEALSQDMGFEHFALAHHADMRRLRPGQILLQNYPECWVERFVEQGFFVEDPVHQGCARTHAAFAWSDTGSLIRITPSHRHFFELAGMITAHTQPALLTIETR